MPRSVRIGASASKGGTEHDERGVDHLEHGNGVLGPGGEVGAGRRLVQHGHAAAAEPDGLGERGDRDRLAREHPHRGARAEPGAPVVSPRRAAAIARARSWTSAQVRRTGSRGSPVTMPWDDRAADSSNVARNRDMPAAYGPPRPGCRRGESRISTQRVRHFVTATPTRSTPRSHPATHAATSHPTRPPRTPRSHLAPHAATSHPTRPPRTPPVGCEVGRWGATSPAGATAAERDSGGARQRRSATAAERDSGGARQRPGTAGHDGRALRRGTTAGHDGGGA